MKSGMLWLVLPVFLIGRASPGTAQTATEMIENAQRQYSIIGCPRAEGPDEVVVCGSRDPSRKYRLPLPQDETRSDSGSPRGDVPRASTETAASGPCGIFQGQRNCNKADAAEYGYGNGRDPITVASKIISKLADPD